MTLRVVGAGLSRTGTLSLKVALERLLGGRCYHMLETFGRPDDFSIWQRAFEGELPNWDEFLGGYVVTLDLPAAAFWPELHETYPDAVVLLSVRDVDDWWRSASRTVFKVAKADVSPDSPAAATQAMTEAMWRTRFAADVTDEQSAKTAYERHNDAVRRGVPPDRLVEWTAGDGWQPICAALDLPVPDDPFPHLNTTDDFQAIAASMLPPESSGV